MQRVYQFHHFGKGSETYRRPKRKATLVGVTWTEQYQYGKQ